MDKLLTKSAPPIKTLGKTLSGHGKQALVKGISGRNKIFNQNTSLRNMKTNESPQTFSGTTNNSNSSSTKTKLKQEPVGILSRMTSFSFKSDNNEEEDILSKIEERDDLAFEKSIFEIWRLRTKSYLAYSWYGTIYEWSLHILSIASCLLFIIETYLPVKNFSPYEYKRQQYLNAIEIITASIFTFDFLLALFIADHRLEYLRSFFSLVDLLTVIPTWATLGTEPPLYLEINNAYLGILYILNLFKVTRILRPLRIRRKLQHIEDEVQRVASDMILRIFIMVLFNTGVIQYLEYQDQPFDFHTWMYFLWITTATVGYGDITPQTILGRVAVMYIICFSIVVIPQMTNNLLAAMAKSSIYARAVFTPKVNSSHIIICGDLSSTAITELFEELYHPDHQSFNLFSVILYDGVQTVEMKEVLSNPLYELNIIYLEGTLLNERDLRRAAAESAEAIFLFTNKFTTNPDRDDAKTILLHHSIKRYIEEHKGYDYVNNHVIFCVQLVRPENQKHFETGGISTECSTEHVICLNEIKMGIIAKSVMFPGTAALIMNLLASFAEDSDSEDDEEENKITTSSSIISVKKNNVTGRPSSQKIKTSGKHTPTKDRNLFIHNATTNNKSLIAAPRNSEESSPITRELNKQLSQQLSSFVRENSITEKKMLWTEEYSEGCQWEIYSTDISPAFEGVLFNHLAYALYDKLGIILIGIQIEDLANDTNSIDENIKIKPPNRARTILNPADYIFPSSTKFKLKGLVIAQNKSSADLSNVTGKLSLFSRAIKFGTTSMGVSTNGLGNLGISGRSFSSLGNLGVSTNNLITKGLSTHGFTNLPLLSSANSLFHSHKDAKINPIGIRETDDEEDDDNDSSHRVSSYSPPISRKLTPTNKQINDDMQVLSNLIDDKVGFQLNESGILSDNKIDNVNSLPTSKSGSYTDHDKFDVNFLIQHQKTVEIKKQKHRKKLLEKFENIVNSSASQQEKEYQLDLEFLLTNYYLRPNYKETCTQEECLIKTSVLEEIAHCHNHIIVTGSGLGNLFDLIKPLRAREVGKLQYIVILTPTDIPNGTWQRISVFEGIMIVKGTPTEEEDIRRAGVFRAQQVVILANSWKANSTAKQLKSRLNSKSTMSTEAGLEALLDSDTIFAYKAVKRMNDSAQCIVEFIKDDNINYLNPETGLINKEGDDYKDSPQFAAGELFASSLLDTVVCQAFYNPNIVNIINRFICAKDSSELVVAAAQNAKKVGVFQLAPIDQINGSSLYQIELPKKLANCRYGVLFKKLADQGVIPIGLYRAVPRAAMFLTNPGYLNRLPYVYTNPPKDTEVNIHDKVFVLSAKPLHSIKIQTEEEVELDHYMDDEVFHVLHNPRKQHREQTTAKAIQRWSLLLKRCELYYSDELIDHPNQLQILIDILNNCKLRIENAKDDEVDLHLPSDDESDSDSDESVEEFKLNKSFSSNISRNNSIMNSISNNNNNNNINNNEKKNISGNNDDNSDSDDYNLIMRSASRRIRKILGPTTKQLKDIVDNYLPVINVMVEALELKFYYMIRNYSDKYSIRANDDGYFKLSIYFATLRDVLDAVVKINPLKLKSSNQFIHPNHKNNHHSKKHLHKKDSFKKLEQSLSYVEDENVMSTFNVIDLLSAEAQYNSTFNETDNLHPFNNINDNTTQIVNNSNNSNLNQLSTNGIDESVAGRILLPPLNINHNSNNHSNDSYNTNYIHNVHNINNTNNSIFSNNTNYTNNTNNSNNSNNSNNTNYTNYTNNTNNNMTMNSYDNSSFDASSIPITNSYPLTASLRLSNNSKSKKNKTKINSAVHADETYHFNIEEFDNNAENNENDENNEKNEEVNHSPEQYVYHRHHINNTIDTELEKDAHMLSNVVHHKSNNNDNQKLEIETYSNVNVDSGSVTPIKNNITTDKLFNEDYSRTDISLPTKAIDILSDMIDAIEIAIWDSGVPNPF